MNIKQVIDVFTQINENIKEQSDEGETSLCQLMIRMDSRTKEDKRINWCSGIDCADCPLSEDNSDRLKHLQNEMKLMDLIGVDEK